MRQEASRTERRRDKADDLLMFHDKAIYGHRDFLYGLREAGVAPGIGAVKRNFGGENRPLEGRNAWSEGRRLWQISVSAPGQSARRKNGSQSCGRLSIDGSS